MNKNQSTILALVVLIIIAIVVGVIVSKQGSDRSENQVPEMQPTMPADESGTPVSNSNDTQSIESDLNATNFGSLDSDMNDSISAQ